MKKPKPYKAKSLKGAEREVRALRKQWAKTCALLERYAAERDELKDECNWLREVETDACAERRRLVALLAQHGLNPDGSQIGGAK